ncbi:MAG: hypothetical protein QM736_23205 [Vicinamibacterales bacterium]
MTLLAGTSSGIGLHTAMTLARGAVVATMRNADGEGDSVIAMIGSRLGQ